ncbi:DNA topology modulation protein [Paenibacillus lignilyticus]|uniref:DNA topology modulation protein n=1 Tax=Paenibacillus lignilyticus TaxID=1172615 RepID=A0ABS5CCN9_9BACL|nr:DNA topology modulation protein [Paenibacillus lignilyticus]MBP3962893.1 DNA topology modulation protein [Paenibacillus lignilyticus]
MKKMILIGSGGSGKSTLARKLGELLSIEVHHLDALLWKPDWIAVSKEEQITIQDELLGRDRWIIDGNYGGTLDRRIKAADTVIFVDLSRWICLYRVLKRRFRHRHTKRIDMAEGCEERITLHFMRWVWAYPSKHKPKIMKQLMELSNDKSIIVLKTRSEVRTFLERIEREASRRQH